MSWVFYKTLGSDIQALIFSGVLFSSFAVFPLYELARRVFSKEAAILASVLYIVNPQVWLQAEKPLSDAFGLFFVITSVLLFYMAVEGIHETSKSYLDKENDKYKTSVTVHPHLNLPHQGGGIQGDNEYSPPLVGGVRGGGELLQTSLVCFALGGVLLGLGLGVRVTYLALIPTMAYAAYQMTKKICIKKVTLLGLLGFSVGIAAWLGYLFFRFTPYKCYKKFLSHADYHFYRAGNSILTTDDYSERFFDIFHNLSAHSLGAWWTDTPFLRIIPTIIIALTFVCFFIHEKWNFKNRFLLAFFIPYSLWIAFIQDAIRQIMVLIPFLIIIMSAGLIHGFTHYAKDRKWGFSLFFGVVFTFIVTQVVDSVKIVSINKNEEPPSVSTINYITKNYERDDTKFYCLNDWRLFQYYAPEWCDKKNSHVYFVSTMSGVIKDLGRLKNKPKNILVSSKLFERHKHKDRLRKLAVFERNRYAVADYNWLALYSFE
ncbi:MAG: glycosyltransferase family 39 protein [Planctomycetes bacterium]|nr:glycosyltransferase family 39 protein [Planctomycetota bacterium]